MRGHSAVRVAAAVLGEDAPLPSAASLARLRPALSALEVQQGAGQDLAACWAEVRHARAARQAV